MLSSHSASSGAVSSVSHLRIILTSRVTEAAGDMVVDQPTGLHKGITDCRADKLKAAFFNAFDSASEAGVVAGISASVAARVTCGALSTKDQTKSVNDSPFSSIAR